MAFDFSGQRPRPFSIQHVPNPSEADSLDAGLGAWSYSQDSIMSTATITPSMMEDIPAELPQPHQPPPKRTLFELAYEDDEEPQDSDICAVLDDFVVPDLDPSTEFLSFQNLKGNLPERLSSVESSFASSSRPTSRLSGVSSVPSRLALPAEARELLDKWLEINRRDPYLKPNDANALAHLTGLTAQQVKNYVANARARKFPSAVSLDRDDSAITIASMSSTSSFQPPKRGRRRHRDSNQSTGSVADRLRDPLKIYQCTFCDQQFSRKGDWKRHEQSSHMPQEEWLCMPEGPEVLNETMNLVCVFCDTEWPDAQHHAEHRALPCMDKPLIERTFTRKDKLQQHLTQVHKLAHMTRHMQGWVQPINRDVMFRCGLCGLNIASWGERVEHIAAHFEEGLDMSSWQGPLGGVVPRPPTLSFSMNV